MLPPSLGHLMGREQIKPCHKPIFKFIFSRFEPCYDEQTELKKKENSNIGPAAVCSHNLPGTPGGLWWVQGLRFQCVKSCHPQSSRHVRVKTKNPGFSAKQSSEHFWRTCSATWLVWLGDYWLAWSSRKPPLVLTSKYNTTLITPKHTVYVYYCVYREVLPTSETSPNLSRLPDLLGSMFSMDALGILWLSVVKPSFELQTHK